MPSGPPRAKPKLIKFLSAKAKKLAKMFFSKDDKFLC
jgi:hypothetical protein